MSKIRKHLHLTPDPERSSCQGLSLSEHTNTASEKAMTAPQQDGDPSGGGEPANKNESMESNQNPNVPSELTLRLWNDVAEGIDKNSTGEEGEGQSNYL